jgi:hypothetical protein
MKRIKNWVVSEYQKEWVEAINKTEIQAFICKWFDEAKAIIDLCLKYEYLWDVLKQFKS